MSLARIWAVYQAAGACMSLSGSLILLDSPAVTTLSAMAACSIAWGYVVAPPDR